MTNEIKDWVLEVAHNMYEGQIDEPLTSDEMENLLIEFAETLILKLNPID